MAPGAWEHHVSATRKGTAFCRKPRGRISPQTRGAHLATTFVSKFIFATVLHQTVVGNSSCSRVKSPDVRICEWQLALLLELFQTVLFSSAGSLGLHETLETFPRNACKLRRIGIELAENLPALLVHELAVRSSSFGTASLQVLMLAEYITVGVGPWRRNIREPAVALPLLFLGEFLFGLGGGLVGLFQPEKRLFDPRLADKVSRLGFGEREDTSDDSKFDRPQLAQRVPQGFCFLGIIVLGCRRLLVLFAIRALFVVFLATGLFGIVAIIGGRSVKFPNDTVRVFSPIHVVDEMRYHLVNPIGIVVELACLLNRTQIKGSQKGEDMDLNLIGKLGQGNCICGCCSWRRTY
mmetsp:Transcript_12735/g.32098  ORF Transcript_12735/g.32098 Transcript_12735/m.32098 type:complete len:351 (+) Transcript_12735:2712-3764(+)